MSYRSRSRGEEYDDALDTHVFSHNWMPTVAVRGADWKYVWQPHADELYDFDTGEISECRNDDLRKFGARLVEDWREAHAERERIASAADSIAGDGVL